MGMSDLVSYLRQTSLAVLLLRFVIAVFFGFLFLRNLTDFYSLYFKFSLIDIIYKNNLGFLFYAIVAFQLFLSVFIFWVYNRFIKVIYETTFIIYTALVVSYLVYINSIFGGCIDCNYGTSYFNEDFVTTIVISFMLIVFYFFAEWLERNQIRKRKT